MKTYNELTNYERANLTDDEFERYLDIARMLSDITIDDPSPPVDEILSKLEYVTVFEVQIDNWKDVAAFTEREDAEAMLALSVIMIGTDYQIGTPYVDQKPKSLRIVEKRIATADSYAKHKPNLELRKKLANDCVRHEHQRKDAIEQLERELEPMREDRERCRGLSYTVECVRAKFREYLALCDGDENVARRFLEKHYSAESIELADSWPRN
jgi:hypothetical protein